MFLFERVLGFGTYMLVLLMVCLFLVKTNAQIKTVLKVYLFCLCVMAFFYKPYITGDLYKIYEQMDYFSTMNFKVFWSTVAWDDSMLPIARLIFWFFGKIGIRGLLPASSAFVCYSAIFYVITKTQKMYSVSNITLACVLFYVMTTSIYISVVGGIRMMLALSFITFAYFRGTVEKKVTVFDISLYVLSTLIHTMSYVVVAICILVSLFDAKRGFVRTIGYIFVTAIGVWAFVVNFSDIVYGLLYQKFIFYILESSGYSDSWEYVMGVLIIITLIILFVEFRKINKENDYHSIKKQNTAMIYCIAIALIFSFEFSVFYRFGGQLAVLFSIPVLMVTLEKTKGASSFLTRSFDFKSVLIMFSVIIAIISCTRGSLSSLKFFEL